MTINGNLIAVSGFLNGTTAEEICGLFTENIVYVLDFSEVTGVNFAALRTLLSCRRSGSRFCIINAPSEVAERFEDTGVSSFINICRKPRPLKLEQYSEFGASFMSKAYNSEDGDSMIKVYGANVPKWVVAQEKAVARSVMVFGLNTPLVGTIYEDGARTALDFERIEGKRSFSRIISEEPERLEEISRRFARMCKQLHTTKCDTGIFADRKVYYRQTVLRSTAINDEERKKVLAFIDSIPDATTCLHGDMQLSNVITNGKEDLWIDLSDFGYGYPMLDMGMWYFLCILNVEEITFDLFHLHKEDMARIWDCFVEEYFGADTAAKKAEVAAGVEKYAALHMLYLGSNYGFKPGMMEYIREKIL